MYQISAAIDINFAHHIRGHNGPCISVHGHTWRFEVTLGSDTLDKQGFVADFDVLHAEVLEACHRLLDHSLAIGPATWAENSEALAALGNALVDSRLELHGSRGERQDGVAEPLAGARNEFPGDIKICVFPFTPTSERIAAWLAELSEKIMGDDRVKVVRTRVYETLHPTESYAEYFPTS